MNDDEIKYFTNNIILIRNCVGSEISANLPGTVKQRPGQGSRLPGMPVPVRGALFKLPEQDVKGASNRVAS